MKFNCIFSRALRLYGGRRVSPEWGGGGIFGLTYTNGTLYFTLAFDAVAFFYHDDCGTTVYNFELVGPPPRSGGDTYNAAAAVDEVIYFGGWVHAPARYRSIEGRGAVVDFTSKYSHVHAYDTGDRRIALLWREGAGDPHRWAGEVTDLLYNPVRDTLILARGDGHVGLGVYELERKGGRAIRVSGVRVLRGTVYMDHVCLAHHHGWGGSPGLLCLDLQSYRESYNEAIDVKASSIDGGGLRGYRPGDIAASHTRVLVFGKGGLTVFDPFGSDTPVFVRLFDFGHAPYGPLRSNVLILGGGVLAAFNSMAHSTVRGTDELPLEQQRASRKPPAPTVLVYISPPSVRTVATLGARVTSIAYAAGRLLVATASEPNLERYDATMVDWSTKGILALDPSSILNTAPPPLTIRVEGWMVGTDWFGGIPLEGYIEAELYLKSSRTNVLRTACYTLMDGPGTAQTDKIGVSSGWNRVDLRSPRGCIVAFRLENPDPQSVIMITLR